MKLYSIHANPSYANSSDNSLQDAKMVHDGFNLWALAFPVIWCVSKGLWWYMLLLAVGFILVFIASDFFYMHEFSVMAMNIGIHIYAAFDSRDWLRSYYNKKGYVNLGFYPGDTPKLALYNYMVQHKLSDISDEENVEISEDS